MKMEACYQLQMFLQILLSIKELKNKELLLKVQVLAEHLH
jgi:hypothetical protein